MHHPHRQRGLLLAAAGVSAILSVLATFLAIGLLKQKDLQRHAQAEAMKAREIAEVARIEANRGTRARDEAEQMVEFLLDDLSLELELIDRSDLMVAAATKAADYFNSLPPELVTRDTQDKRASILVKLGQAFYAQGNLDAAESTLRQAIDIRRELASGEDPEGEFRFILAREISELALFQSAADNFAGARQSYEEAMEIFSQPPPLAIRDGHWDFGLATAHFGLGELDRMQARYEDALEDYQEASRFAERALEKQPRKPGWMKKRMNLQNNMGVVLMYLQEFKKAEDFYLAGVATARELVRLEPSNRVWEKELGTMLMNVGTCLDEQGEYRRAEPFLREALSIRRGLAAWDPKNARHARSLAHAWHNLSSMQFSTGQGTNALASCREAMSAYRRLLTLDPSNEKWIEDMQLAATKYRNRLVDAGLPDQARQLLEEAARFAESVREGDPQGDAWDDLLTGMYQDIQNLGGTISASEIIDSRRRSLQALATQVDLQPADPEILFRWTKSCLRYGHLHHESGLADAAWTCLQLARLILQDWIPSSVEDRALQQSIAEGWLIEAGLAAGRLETPVILIPREASWSYWDQGNLPDPQWTQPFYDDRHWPHGPAPLGYGEVQLNTTVSYGEDRNQKHLTVWFRHRFQVADPKSIRQVRLHLRRDDGAIVYLNGQEIHRDNMPEGSIDESTVANMTAGDAELVFHPASLNAAAFPWVTGENVLAVEVRQNEPQSSDLAFALEFLANFPLPEPSKSCRLEAIENTLGSTLPQSLRDKLAARLDAHE